MNAKERVERWSKSTPEAFLAWVDDIKPQILQNSKYTVFVPTKKQLYLINEVLKPAPTPIIKKPKPIQKLDKRSTSARAPRPTRKQPDLPKTDTPTPKLSSSFRRSMSLVIQPRRHGKSSLFALMVIWLATSRQNQTIQVLGNSESHTRRTQFNTIKKIIMHTPRLLKLIPERDLFVFEIFCKLQGSVIQMAPGNNVSASFGDRFTAMWVSDLHAAVDLGPYNAMQASLLDSEDSLLLIDSNVDTIDGHVHAVQKEAETDDTIFCDYTSYPDIATYSKEAPPWIDRKKARRLERTLLEADFRRDILGLRSDAVNSLFGDATITICKSDYHISVEDLQSLAQGRTYRIGGGLDRSKSLLGSTFGGDNSIWTCVMKCANPQKDGEPEIFILNQVNVLPNTGSGIKKAILEDHQRYKLDNCILEDYEVSDIYPWVQAQGIPVETMTPHSTRQNSSFPELSRIAKEGRLHFPSDLTDLISEMRTFSYIKAPKGEGYSFGHTTRKQKDDRVFSLNWAVYSLRAQIMNLYSLDNINCKSKTKNKQLCFLLGGRTRLYCGDQCDACQEVEDMYRQFMQYQMDSELELQDFFKHYVKLVGTRIYRML